MQTDVVYLDHAATTGVHPEVLQAMLPYLTSEYGNPSSVHRMGRSARQAVDTARAEVAAVLGCSPSEVVFTSGGSESINLAIKGIVRAAGDHGHVVTTAIEHHAVLHTVEQLEREGYEVTVVGVSTEGIVDPGDVRRTLRPDTRLISVMLANNEIGTLQPVAEIGRMGQELGIPVHSDCVQAGGSLPLDVDELGLTSMALSGHKFYAPKGIGIMYVREGTRLQPQLQGGSQEGGRRAGTENVPYIVGIATALARASRRRDEYNRHCSALRDELFERILGTVPDARVNGHRRQRLANNVHVSFRGIEAQGLLMGLDLQGICASSGSACVSASLEPSHVLAAIGVPEDYIYGSLRLSLGEQTTHDHVDRVMAVLPALVERLQALSPLVTA
ncbi:MAG: cysteine desulfurase [Chloroflexota bacterium]|nr:cysteine desulfurase [Chloroflexota bacterium]